MRKPAVPVKRSSYLILEPHPSSCDLSELRNHVSRLDKPLAVDLFCGAGGLSLGLQNAGFEVVLGVDHDPAAIATHLAHFGGASIQGDLSDVATIEAIGKALDEIPISLVAGGPPCQPFSRAGMNKIRSLVHAGVRQPIDSRRDLWQGFIAIVERLTPPAVLVENVADFALGDNSPIYRGLLSALEALGYRVYSRVLRAWRFGVPQHRQRLFVVALRGRAAFDWPVADQISIPTVRDAISDLPPVEAGAEVHELPYDGPRSSFQSWCRVGMPPEAQDKIHDHITRSVRADDLEAFALMDHRTLYAELPPHLRRYRTDIFDDKYKRLPWDGLARTITAHIAKDGYWYIHPKQHRTLTVREAARIQTFPDRFRFTGTRSHAFRQIGDAVPPLLAQVMGNAILRALVSEGRVSSRTYIRSCDVSATVVRWIKEANEDDLKFPWLRTQNPWYVLAGLTVLHRIPGSIGRTIWSRFREHWTDPELLLNDQARHELFRQWGAVGRLPTLDALATALLVTNELSMIDAARVPGLTPDRMQQARTLTGVGTRLVPTATLTRVVERLFGESTEKSRQSAQLLLARAVGTDTTGLAYAGLMEIGAQFCKPVATCCQLCPMTDLCATGRAETGQDNGEKSPA